jgi:CRP-like cAMP-binding protein
MATSSPPIDLRAASLFDVDPELGELLDAQHLAEARARAIVAVAELAPGPWSPAALRDLGSRPFALLVLDGLLVRDILLAGGTATELLGPSDIVDLGVFDDSLLPTGVRWSVPERARVAILDDRLLAIVRTWPAVARIMLERTARRGGRLAVHRAIAQLPRVDQRLVAFFGHLAERWGRVASAGIVVPLQLTHETLGRLIGARRPTVSLALKELAAAGVLERRHDGAWLLSYEALEALSGSTNAGAAWQPADARAVTPEDAVGMGARRAQQPPALGPDDVAALLTRVTFLQQQHIASVRRSATVRERSRATRAAWRASGSPAPGVSAWANASVGPSATDGRRPNGGGRP